MDRRELRQYEAWKAEAQFLRAENQHLRLELNACRPELYHAGRRVGELEERVAKLETAKRGRESFRLTAGPLGAILRRHATSQTGGLRGFGLPRAEPLGRAGDRLP